MKKIFMGVKLRSLRAERGLSQTALAQALEISPSYLNQIEQNQRPLTVQVLLKLHRVLGVDIQQFSEDEEARLLAALREALADAPTPVPLPELQQVVTQMPALGQAIVALQQQRQQAQERIETLALRLGDGRSQAALAPAMPYEVVRDFFFAHRNYVDSVDRAAEALAAQAPRLASGALAPWLVQRLHTSHGVSVQSGDAAGGSKRRFDPGTRTLMLADGLTPAQQAFELATQLALLEQEETFLRCLDEPFLAQAGEPARKLARVGLANYYAGALLLPYGAFLAAAESLRYDIELLQQRFGVGFETVCHRLSTLQRADAPGVPFFLVRVDRAGNISKRQSATHFHFSRTGGTCPLWNVYEAFSQPERVLRQIASMPDGRRYLWIARTVSGGQRGYGAPGKNFSIGLGCDIRHAQRLVYAQGLDLQDPEAATPIGMGCKVCERENCPQRAFPYVGRSLAVDENRSQFTPYGSAS
ncbi:MAG: short-chain fatty acyl-CoA regulator family protein [Burkholderiales bacterium]|nr:short-chain fatty acyl-CoA regulator family protein [Burkholderiales bacterium]